MKKIISMVAGAALMAASSLGAAAPVQAAHHWQWDQGRIASAVDGWCATHPWSSDCSPHHRDKWSHDDYQRWYSRHHGEHGFDPGLAALFGFAALAGTAAAVAHHSH